MTIKFEKIQPGMTLYDRHCERAGNTDKPKHQSYQPMPGDHVRCVHGHSAMSAYSTMPFTIGAGQTFNVGPRAGTDEQSWLSLAGFPSDLRWPLDAFEPIQTFVAGNIVRCIDTTGSAATFLELGRKYSVKEIVDGGNLVLTDTADFEWATWRFVLTTSQTYTAEAPGEYEKHSGKPFMGPRTPAEQEMKYNARDVATTVGALIAKMPPRRCACCGFAEKAEAAPTPWARWAFAATLGEAASLCPSCAKQTAEFIAHLKDKNNPAAASVDSGAWYHEDWD